MAIHRVAQLGEPVLRQPASAVGVEEIDAPRTTALVDDLIDTMRDYDGVGIAAPQIRVAKRVLVIEVRNSERYRHAAPYPLTVVLNPVLTPLTEETASGWEGCLSVEGLRGLVPRFTRVSLRGLDQTGEGLELVLEGFPAVVAQHEADHLEGNVYLDRMPDLATLAFLREFERYHKPHQ